MVGRRHLRRERGRQQRGTERHEELDALGERDQRRGCDPCVLAPGAARREHAVVAEGVARRGDLSEVRVVWCALVAIALGEDITRVASGRQEPVHA